MAGTTAAKARTSKVSTDEEPDLLAGMLDSSPAAPDDDEDFDLLSDMSESDATAWMPWDEEDQPKGIQGTVVHVGTVTQDAKYGGDEVPYIELRDKNDANFIWGIRGYATVLKNQLEREVENGLKSGDFFATVYQGVKQNRKGDNEYKAFTTKSVRK